MIYRIGQTLLWHSMLKSEPPVQVTVRHLMSYGLCRLSNGFVVDEGGYSDGGIRHPGGWVTVITRKPAAR